MTGRHRPPPPQSRWHTSLSIAAGSLAALSGTVGAAEAFAVTPTVDSVPAVTPPTLTETAQAVRGPRGPLALPTIGPSNRWDPSKGEVLPTSAYVPPPVVEPEPTTEPSPEPTTAPVTTTATPTTTTAGPTTTTATPTTVAPTTTVPAPTETTATTTATPTDTSLPTPTLPTVSEEPQQP